MKKRSPLYNATSEEEEEEEEADEEVCDVCKGGKSTGKIQSFIAMEKVVK